MATAKSTMMEWILMTKSGLGMNWQPDLTCSESSSGIHLPLSGESIELEFVMKHPKYRWVKFPTIVDGMILPRSWEQRKNQYLQRETSESYDAIPGKRRKLKYRVIVIWTVYKDWYSCIWRRVRLVLWQSGNLHTIQWNWYLLTSISISNPAGRGHQETKTRCEQIPHHGDPFGTGMKIEHAQFGACSDRRFSKDYGRAHPGFLLDAGCHIENAAFTIYHAYSYSQSYREMDVKEEELWSDLKAITRDNLNERWNANHASQGFEIQDRETWIMLTSHGPK